MLVSRFVRFGGHESQGWSGQIDLSGRIGLVGPADNNLVKIDLIGWADRVYVIGLVYRVGMMDWWTGCLEWSNWFAGFGWYTETGCSY